MLSSMFATLHALLVAPGMVHHENEHRSYSRTSGINPAARVAVVDFTPEADTKGKQYLGITVTASGVQQIRRSVHDHAIDVVVVKLSGCAGTFSEVWPMIEAVEALEQGTRVILWGTGDICSDFAIATCGVDNIIMSPGFTFGGCVSTANANWKTPSRTLADYAATLYACRMSGREPMLMAPSESDGLGRQPPHSLENAPMVYGVTGIVNLESRDGLSPAVADVLSRFGVPEFVVVDIDELTDLRRQMSEGMRRIDLATTTFTQATVRSAIAHEDRTADAIARALTAWRSLQQQLLDDVKLSGAVGVELAVVASEIAGLRAIEFQEAEK